MFDSEFSTGQRRQQIDFRLAEQIVTLPLEPRVVLFFHDKDDISRFDTGRLIALSGELDLLTALHTLVDVNLEHFTFLLSFFTVALLASVLGVDDFTGSVTVATRLLDLLNHRAELSQRDSNTLPVTRLTLLDGTLLSAEPITALAQDRL